LLHYYSFLAFLVTFIMKKRSERRKHCAPAEVPS